MYALFFTVLNEASGVRLLGSFVMAGRDFVLFDFKYSDLHGHYHLGLLASS